MNEKKKRKSVRLYLPVGAVILMIVVAGFFWYRNYTSYISTDDAHVDTDNIAVSAKILGRITRVYADEGDAVAADFLLAELDSSDLLAQKSRVLAMIGQARASLVQAQAKYGYDQENIRIPEINYERAQDDFNRAQNQFEAGIITQQQYDHARSAFETANAQLQAARTQLNVSRAQIASAQSAVESAYAELKVVESQLNNTRLYAPIDGVVAKRWLLPGDVAQPGQSVFTVTNNHNLWVVVYLEETKIADVHMDQQVHFTIDAFPDVMFTGRVFSIGSNTASQFSLIPQNNASGNFTKVTQRIPLKVSIEDTNSQDEVDAYKILAGMSAVVKILRDR